MLIQLAAEAESEAASSSGPPNMGKLFFPSALFMTLLFMAQGLSGEIWTEREQGTLRRVASTPVSLLSVTAGRTLAFAALMGSLSALALPAGFYLVGVEAARPVVAVLWLVASGCVIYLLMTLAAGPRDLGADRRLADEHPGLSAGHAGRSVFSF